MILVAGATGQVGQATVRALRNLGRPVRALVRKGSEYYWLNDSRCQYFFGDLRDPGSLSRACRDVRHVVVCSGVRTESRDNDHTTVTVDGHRALFDAARQRGVERVVLVSCLGADRGYPMPAFDARQKAEQALVDSGLDHTILRACAHEGTFLALAMQGLRGGRVWLPGPGTAPLNPIATKDLALMAAACLDQAAVKNRVVEVGGPERVTGREAVEAACLALGVQPRIAVLPPPVVGLARRAGRPLRRYAHRLGELATWFSDAFTVDEAAVRRTFGHPMTPLAQAMAETGELMLALRDPAEREKRMIHPQFYATVYAPGEARLAELPSGPPPRRD